MTDYKFVRDIPDTYRLLQGDAAREIAADCGCAFVLVDGGEILDAYVTGYAVPWNDAPVARFTTY